jgi:Arc/MetJ family transcription regulator
MRKHTTIDLDMELVRQAGAALGTQRVTETVHAALDAVVRHRRRMDFLALDPAIDLADLGQMRSHRFAETGAHHATVKPTKRQRS